MRECAYPRWVAQERMTQAKADLEIALMKRVLVRLRSLQQPALFEAPELDLCVDMQRR